MWVSPFRDLRVIGYLLLAAAYRSLSRLSSALSAKASTLCSCSLNLFPASCGVGRVFHTQRCMSGMEKIILIFNHSDFSKCCLSFTIACLITKTDLSLNLSGYLGCLNQILRSISVFGFQGTTCGSSCSHPERTVSSLSRDCHAVMQDIYRSAVR